MCEDREGCADAHRDGRTHLYMDTSCVIIHGVPILQPKD